MGTKRNTTLELTVDPNYIQSWDVRDGIRELMQNAIDAQDYGHPMTVDYKKHDKVAKSKLRIRNDGVTLSREVMLFGSSTKRNDANQRGEFGEGLKLAWLVLVRGGYSIICRSGGEIWEPFIGYSKTFGTDTLQVKIRPASVFKNRVSIEVVGISEADWDVVQDRCLFLRPPEENEIVRVGKNALLLGERFRNKLFCKDIFVGILPQPYNYGYNLYDIRVDRDRKIADPWDLKYAIRKLLSEAVKTKFLQPEQIYKILTKDCGESEALASEYAYSASDDLTKGVADLFRKEYGEKAVPVTTISESKEAGHYGLRGVVIPAKLAAIVAKETGDFEQLKEKSATDTAKLYSWTELDEEEQTNLDWAADLITLTDHFKDVSSVNVVDFIGDTVCGTYKDGHVNIARRMLKNREELLNTMVHEVAHLFGSDGTIDHSEAMNRLYIQIIMRMKECSDYIDSFYGPVIQWEGPWKVGGKSPLA